MLVNVCITYKPQASRTEWRNKQYLIKAWNSKCLCKVWGRFSCSTVYPTVKTLLGILESGSSELFWLLTRINGPSRGADCRLVTYKEDTKKKEKHDPRESSMWVERLIKHFLSYFSLCPAPQWTLLFPSFSNNPTLHSGFTHQVANLITSFSSGCSLVWDTIIQLLRKNQQTSIQEGHRVLYHHSFSLKTLSESHRRNKKIWLFSSLHLPQSHFHDFFHTLNIILTLTFDSTCVSLHLRWSFCTPDSPLNVPWELISHPIAILSCVQRTNWMRFVSDKVRMSLFSDLDRLERGLCSRTLICILNFHPVWIWKNTFIQGQYFATI